MKILRFITKQYDIGLPGRWFAVGKDLYNRVLGYYGMVNIAVNLTILWSVTAREQIREYVPWFEVWMLFAVVAVGLALFALFEWKISVPATYKLSNEQQTKHRNPTYLEVKALEEKLDILTELMGYKEAIDEIIKQRHEPR